MKDSYTDIFYMKQALQLAAKGKGTVSPNPLVGAVIVKDNTIIAKGYHKIYGGPHAENNALNNAAQSVKGATLYCNLEPCCHVDKQTPPCAQRLIKEGIKRVVIANRDPNPQVNGRGIDLLKKAGVEIITGVMEEQGKELNKFYLKYSTTHLPYITVKIAQTLDGCVAKTKDRREIITGMNAQRYVHRLRSSHDALLIGGNTLRIDNSRLNVRHISGADPLRIILSASLNFNPASHIFSMEPKEKTWILTSKMNKEKAMQIMAKSGCQVFMLPSDNSKKIPISTVLNFLAQKKITSLLVEGGTRIFSQFIYGRFTDELNLLIAPVFWGSPLKSLLPSGKELIIHYNLYSSTRLGQDTLLSYRRQQA